MPVLPGKRCGKTPNRRGRDQDTKALETFKGEAEVGGWVGHRQGDLEQE